MATPDISVVVPVLNAERYLPALLEALRAQEPVAPHEVLLIESGSQDKTVSIASKFPEVKVIPIDRFSHGRARNLGIRQSCGEFVVLMSQDAVPRDKFWLRELLSPFSDPKVAAAFSRQVPRPDASPMEQFFLETHFPDVGRRYVRPSGTSDMMFQRDVFFSDVSSVIRRSVALQHPFDETIIMSEDQQFARDVMTAGYAVDYAPSSVVIHSHDYSYRQVFGRYFDSAYSLTAIFAKHKLSHSIRIGSSYLRREAGHIIAHHPRVVPRYAGYVLARTAGAIMGHFADSLPRSCAKRLSAHSYFWTIGQSEHRAETT